MKAGNSALFIICLLFCVSCSGVNSASQKPNKATSIAAVAARIPTDTPAPPTPTIPPEDVVKDISQAKLELEDFPAGFRILSVTDMQEMGMTPESLATGFTEGLAKAKAHNPVGFLRQEETRMEIVISMVVYPLTMLESSGFDMDLSEPEKMMADFTAGMGTNAQILAGAQEIGDKSVGFEVRLTQEKASDAAMRSQAVLVRRSNAMQMIFMYYMEGQQPSVQAVDLAQILDTRTAEALSK